MTSPSELRPDLQMIADLVPIGAKLLDVGCGDGALLAWLKAHTQAIARGLSVIQGNAETDLHFYRKASHDIVVLSRTLQAMHDPVAVLQEILRIGKQAIISIPNFGYWKNRAYLGLRGRMPVTKTLTYEWYNTPNIHFCTLHDFVDLCALQKIQIHQRIYLRNDGQKSLLQRGIAIPNVLAEQALFVLSSQEAFS
jgi:methionine biosynthesis protein MetW